MSQNKKPKEKLGPRLENSIIVNQPMERNYSTGGGHLPGDTIIEGDKKIPTKKWQGYPPVNLNVIGKLNLPMPEVMIPRFTGKAEYTSRVHFPNLLHAVVLGSPHPRARIKSLDTTRAEKMPGVAYVLTYKNLPKSYPMRPTGESLAQLREEVNFQGQLIAIVAAENEDLAEDAIEAIEIEYELLPSAATIAQITASNAPDLRDGRDHWRMDDHYGDVAKAFAQADVIKEFSYYWYGGVPFPMQPVSCLATWSGDKLTLWGMGQEIFGLRNAVASQLGMKPDDVHYINKWNGCTFGASQNAARKFYPYIAHIAKVTGRPTKLVLPKDQELAALRIKPENVQKFKMGVTKDGKIIASQREFIVNAGEAGGPGGAGGGGGRSELYLHVIPNWRETGISYRTNTIMAGSGRSNMQQEFKWGWEQMMDELAESIGMDPVQFRLLNVQKPGTKVSYAQGGYTVVPMPEGENDMLTYDSYASVEVLQEGMKVIGWEKRNPVPGGNTGRFKRGMGVAMSQHHAGRVGYQEGEAQFEMVIEKSRRPNGGDERAEIFSANVEVNSLGQAVLYYAQPDSGSNHGSSMSCLVAEILGYTNLKQIRLVWGDSELTPVAPGWGSGRTTQLQGGALNNAADKLRRELLRRAALELKEDVGKLQIRDGVISSTADPKKRTTFAALARANEGGVIRQTGRCVHPGAIGRAMNRGIGACFVEVEVDTWTGNWRFVRAAYCHDSGNIICPLLGEADMHGSLIQSTHLATESIPWDREFPGFRHHRVGYLSYRLPTIMDIPEEQTNVFINSLEPRWFFGTKGFAETSIGAVPGALANAIYNACGVRIREHPITREKIMAGLNALRRKA